jgi:hypothetical protein
MLPHPTSRRLKAAVGKGTDAAERVNRKNLPCLCITLEVLFAIMSYHATQIFLLRIDRRADTLWRSIRWRLLTE